MRNLSFFKRLSPYCLSNLGEEQIASSLWRTQHLERLLKLILVSFLVFAWLLQQKATHCGILTVRSNHDTSSARSALRAIHDGGRVI